MITSCIGYNWWLHLRYPFTVNLRGMHWKNEMLLIFYTITYLLCSTIFAISYFFFVKPRCTFFSNATVFKYCNRKRCIPEECYKKWNHLIKRMSCHDKVKTIDSFGTKQQSNKQRLFKIFEKKKKKNVLN
jgi:hypothetical protein